MIFALITLTFYAGILILLFGGMWKTFHKAGQPGWAAIIPIYNILVMADVARVSRTQVWKGLAAMLIGFSVYLYTIYDSLIMRSSGEINSSTFAIGFAIYLVAIIIALIFFYPIYKGIALNFGQSVGFAWGLMFLNVIFFAILGFGSAQYQGGSYLNDDLLDSGL